MEGLKTFFENYRKSTHAENESRRDNSQLWVRYSLVDVFRFLMQMKTKEEKSRHAEYLTNIIRLSPRDWLIESIQIKAGDIQLHKQIRETIQTVLVPTYHNKEHYVFDENDFHNVAYHAERILCLSTALLTRLKQPTDSSSGDVSSVTEENDKHIIRFFSDVCPYMLVLAFEHIEENLWTTESSMVSARNFLRFLFNLWDVEDYEQLLQFHLSQANELHRVESTVLYQVFKILKPSLLRDSWKKNPGAKYVFTWCLQHSSFPNLSEHLETVLPPVLLITDDYMIENKICGVNCLTHIMKNVSAEELRWYGRGEVILEALRHHLYSKEPDLLSITIPAVVQALRIVEKEPNTDNGKRTLNRYDEIYQQLLQDAEGENILALRRIYTRHLRTFIDLMGITVVRHLGKTLKVIGNFLEISDAPKEEARLNVLLLLQQVIKVCWPRIHCYISDLLRMLIKCLCDLSLDRTTLSEAVITDLIETIKETMVLIKCLDEDKIREQLGNLDCESVPELCRQTCRQVIEKDISSFTA